MSRRRASGMTLIELVIAVSVMLVAVAAATTLLIAAMRMSRDVQGNVEAGERARLAATELLEHLGRAGLGSYNGVNVVTSGTLKLVSPVYGYDGTTGNGAAGAAIPLTLMNSKPPTTYVVYPDDIWIIEPSRYAFDESCLAGSGNNQNPGSKVAITAATTTGVVLPVTCTAGLAGWTFLMVTSPNACATGPIAPCGKAALLTAGTLTANSIDFVEKSTAGFPPAGASYALGDEVMGVNVTHYYVALNTKDNPSGVAGAAHPALFRATGKILNDGATYGNRIFSDNVAAVEVPDVEDLQIAYGYDSAAAPTNNPDTYTWVHGQPFLAGTGTATGKVLKSVRVTVVARSHQSSQRQTVNPKMFPMPAENDAPAAVADGWEREIFSRRLELPNMAPGNL